MKVILIDDEKLALDVLDRQLERIGGVVVVNKYTKISDALEGFKRDDPDAIFLDVEMGKEFGLNASSLFQSQNKKCPIIFVTAYAKYAVEAFEINALDYLLKPVTINRLNESLKRIKSQLNESNRDNEHMKTLKVYCLGQFRVVDSHGEEVKWRTKKVKELFAYLWHHRGTPINRESIINDLWDDHMQNQARTLLNTTFYQLRKALKQIGINDPVQYQNESYRLNFNVESDLDALILAMKKGECHKDLFSYSTIYMGSEAYSWSYLYNEFLQAKIVHFIRAYIIDQIEEQNSSPENDLLVNTLMRLDPFSTQNDIVVLKYLALSGSKKRVADYFETLQRQYQDELGELLSSETQKVYEMIVTDLT